MCVQLAFTALKPQIPAVVIQTVFIRYDFCTGPEKKTLSRVKMKDKKCTPVNFSKNLIRAWKFS